jgi:shikimate dehydrogenase
MPPCSEWRSRILAPTPHALHSLHPHTLHSPYPPPSVPIDASTRLVSLLGHPVEHSRSPQIHNAAFQAQGVNAAYVATPVRPGALDAAVEGLRALHFLGANVTVPHKEAVRASLDAVTARADAVGAVNTIVREETDTGPDRLRGDNTDIEGFLTPLDNQAGTALDGIEMVLFGAGGAARAVVYGLLTAYAPERLTIVARRPEQGEALAADLAAHDRTDALRVTTFDEAGDAVQAARLLVNATPLGMAPDTEGTPWTNAKDFCPDQVAYDLVYTPEETRFLWDAAAQGATTIGGLDMLVEQAAVAYRQWTDREMPRDAVYEALRA